MNKFKIVLFQIGLVIAIILFAIIYNAVDSKPLEDINISTILDKYDTMAEELAGENLHNIVNQTSPLNQDFFNKITKEDIKHSILIVRIAEIHCSSCMIRDVKYLNKFTENGWDNIQIIASYTNPDYFELFKRVHNITNEIIKVDSYFSSLDIELSDTPYYIIVDNNFIIKELFISTKLSDGRTEYFFKKAFNNYPLNQ